MASIQHGNAPVLAEGTMVAGRIPKKGRAQQITWAPIASASPTSFAGSSYDIIRDAMIETFGPFPIRLNVDQGPVLMAMAAAARDGGEAYKIWAGALERYRGLELVDVE